MRKITEWHVLAGQVIAGQQPDLEEIICDHLQVESIDGLTVAELVDWLRDNVEYTGPFIR